MTRKPHNEFAKQYLKGLLEPLGQVEINREIPAQVQQIAILFTPGSQKGSVHPDTSMTQQPHDQFAKNYLEELLEPLGQVEFNREVVTEVQHIDVWFAPTVRENSVPKDAFAPLGLLGEIVFNTCVLETLLNRPRTSDNINDCLRKLFALHRDLRNAKPEDECIPENELPYLWILATSASAKLLNGFGFQQERQKWPVGVYLMAPAMKTGLIAINQLPVTPETLWLRILGKGATQQEAIRELVALPPDNPFVRNALEQISIWCSNVETKQFLTEDERKLMANLSPAYLQWRETN